MLAIVGKAKPSKTGDIEFFLQAFRQMLADRGRSAYAWSFRPDERASALVWDSLQRGESVYLYLPREDKTADIRMRLAGFERSPGPAGMACPAEWERYCIDELRRPWPIGPERKVCTWFSIDRIEDLPELVRVHEEFVPAFPDKYQWRGRSFFGFLRERGAGIPDLTPSGAGYADLLARAGHGGGGGETIRHRRPKEFVAAHPQVVSLPVACRAEQEYVLPSGDRIDVLFERGREQTAVEVKPITSPVEDIARGVFQCIKYRAVLDAVRMADGRQPGARAILVLEGALPGLLRPVVAQLQVPVIEDVSPA